MIPSSCGLGGRSQGRRGLLAEGAFALRREFLDRYVAADTDHHDGNAADAVGLCLIADDLRSDRGAAEEIQGRVIALLALVAERLGSFDEALSQFVDPVHWSFLLVEGSGMIARRIGAAARLSPERSGAASWCRPPRELAEHFLVGAVIVWGYGSPENCS